MNAKTTKTSKTTKATNTRRRADNQARFMAAYNKATDTNKRAIEVALLMLTEGASPELTQRVTLKLADMWQGDR